MMGTSPRRGWHDCFVSCNPRVETRGYSPVPLRGCEFLYNRHFINRSSHQAQRGSEKLPSRAESLPASVTGNCSQER